MGGAFVKAELSKSTRSTLRTTNTIFQHKLARDVRLSLTCDIEEVFDFGLQSGQKVLLLSNGDNVDELSDINCIITARLEPAALLAELY